MDRRKREMERRSGERGRRRRMGNWMEERKTEEGGIDGK